MKKKLILTTLMIVALIVSSSFSVLADTTDKGNLVSKDAVVEVLEDQTITIDNGEVLQFIQSIEDTAKKEKLLELWRTPAYMVVSNEKYTNTNEEDQLQFIKDLAELPTDEMDKAIGIAVKNVIEEKSPNANIYWEEGFVKKYVDVYAPEEKSRLNLKTALQGEISITDFMPIEQENRSKSGVLRATATASHQNLGGGGLYGLSCTVTYTYSGGKITYMAPQTTVIADGDYFASASWNVNDQKVVSGGSYGDTWKEKMFFSESDPDFYSTKGLHIRVYGTGSTAHKCVDADHWYY